MGKPPANSDNKLYDLLIELKRHLRTCKDCMAAMKVSEPYGMCRYCLQLILDSVKYYDVIISLRVAARNSEVKSCFPCPSLRAHGKTYELTALPVSVIGTQERLV